MVPRNPDRIDVVLDKIRTVWYANPDMRLMQLLENVADRKEPPPSPEQFMAWNDFRKYTEFELERMGTKPMYYMEEDELLERLDEVYGQRESV